MTRKAQFNAEEWETVVDGPLFAGLRMIAADRGGTWRETIAMGQVYQQARADHGSSELLDEIVTSPPSLDAARAQAAGADLGQLAARQLREAVRILEARADPAETDAYKTFVMTVAQAVAEAHREGGLLHLGRRGEVSEAENAALDEIASALGSPPAGAIPGDADG
jgi:hypothetical protein